MVEVVHTEEELKLRTIFASSPDAIAVIDLNGCITECNPAALDMLGHLTRGEVIGRSAFEFVAEKDREKAEEPRHACGPVAFPVDVVADPWTDDGAGPGP